MIFPKLHPAIPTTWRDESPAAPVRRSPFPGVRAAQGVEWRCSSGTRSAVLAVSARARWTLRGDSAARPSRATRPCAAGVVAVEVVERPGRIAAARNMPEACTLREWRPRGSHIISGPRGCSSTVEPQPSKLVTRVRLPSPALLESSRANPVRGSAPPGHHSRSERVKIPASSSAPASRGAVASSRCCLSVPATRSGTSSSV